MQSANHKFKILELLFCFVLRETWGVTMLSERISCHSEVWCHNYYQRIMQSFKNDPYMKHLWMYFYIIPISLFEIYHPYLIQCYHFEGLTKVYWIFILNLTIIRPSYIKYISLMKNESWNWKRHYFHYPCHFLSHSNSK